MGLDPRTPVVVGVGQVTNRPDPQVAPERRPDPCALMAEALRAAARDCGGDGDTEASAAAGARLLRRAGSLAVVGGLGWHLANPGIVIAGALGIDPPALAVSATGGTMPMTLLHRAARMVADGQLDVALVTGGECLHTRAAARKAGVRVSWTSQDPGAVPEPTRIGVDRPPATDLEVDRGVVLPIHAYPLLENAFRAAHGWTVEEHGRRLGELWATFSDVAAGNPHAWMGRAFAPHELTTPGPGNRMVAFPYTKLCTANLEVDQAAAIVCCSVEAARSAGVPAERWVFPLAGAEAADHWFLSERDELSRSPAIRLAGARALALGGVGIDDLAAVDLYSCFPVAVEMAADELGLAAGDPGRPLTLTGGLTFAGGPGNNYGAHGIASMVERLRKDPGAVGLATGLGWYATKHAVGVFASRPPGHVGSPYRWADVQPDVDALPRRAVDPDAAGAVTVETYTVAYERDGTPSLGIVTCRTRDGARAWANVVDPDDMAGIVGSDPIGRVGTLRPGGLLELR